MTLKAIQIRILNLKRIRILNTSEGVGTCWLDPTTIVLACMDPAPAPDLDLDRDPDPACDL